MSTDPATPYRAPEGPRRRRDGRDGLYVVGLTGGLGAGKSSVAKILVESGARLVDADRLGHQVLEDPRVRSELAQAFGPEVLGPEGRVRKDELGRRAFADAPSLARLNAISHPRLLTLLRSALMGFAAAGVRGLVVLEAALLVEWDLGAWCDEVVVVTAPRELRAERARAQRGLSAGEVEERLLRQLPEEIRVRYADRVLVNDGSPAGLAQAARELADSLRAAWQSRERATH
ncbi:MAG TPA: dephospho-CoA kinase [Candidatus Eisenbacteria bacterium]|jgi:dephospho-CoA kinase|nr:dephospho-CoA kinase [Candidatus Eisenbacteria bacterium]